MRFDLKAGLNRLALDATRAPEVTAAPKPEGDKKPEEKKPAHPLATDKKAVVPKKAESEKPKTEPKEAKKADEPKAGDGTLHCPKCGSAGPWTILDMNLRVHNVPAASLSTDIDENEYDDTKGESEGWDAIQDGQVRCNKCKTEYDYNDLVALAEGGGKPAPAAGGAPVEGLEGAKKPGLKAGHRRHIKAGEAGEVKCPQCGKDEGFMTEWWALTINEVNSPAGDPYSWADSEEKSSLESGIFPNSTAVCMACSYEDEAEKFGFDTTPPPGERVED